MPEVQMPKLSDTMTEGTLVSWKKKKGDKVSAGEVIAEIETDKASMEVESTATGVLRQILAGPESLVPIRTPIAIIGSADEAIDDLVPPAGGQGAGPAATAAPTSERRRVLRFDL